MRTLSTDFREDIEAVISDDVVVLFLTITHDDLATPVRVNNDIVDYVYGGQTYFGTGLKLSLLTDEENPPQAKVAIPNADRQVGEAVLALVGAPEVKIELMVKSDFTNAVPRQQVGTPTVEYSAPTLYLRNVSCDAMQLTGVLSSKDVATEAWPKLRVTPDNAPGIFR